MTLEQVIKTLLFSLKEANYHDFFQLDMDELTADVKSKMWFTYRRNFPAIGEAGPSSDKGWGCMLRCGQMVVAQALVNLHLGMLIYFK